MAQTDLDSMNIDAILEQSEAWKASDAEATAKESDDTDLAESLLSCLESCAALKKFNEYDGVVYERPVRKPNQMLDKDDAEGFIMPDCKRVTKTRVVSVDGHSVLKWSIEEETEAEAAVAKPGCAKPAREKKFEHQFTCLKCCKVTESDATVRSCPSEEHTVLCTLCPRTMHQQCNQAGLQPDRMGWLCPQHHCVQCRKSSAQAGGLLFRCISCPATFCPSCLPVSFEAQDGCGELAELGYNPPNSVVYIQHSEEHAAIWDEACLRAAEGDFDREEQGIHLKLQSALLDSDEDSNGYEDGSSDGSPSEEESDGVMDDE